MRICLFSTVTAMVSWGASAPGVKTVVRADEKSGRLVRRMSPIEGASKPAPLQLQKIIEETANKHDVDPLLIDSVIQVESNYNTQAVSPKGALGLMQLIPSTARRFGVKDPFDAQDNLEGGIKYLKYLQHLYSDNRLALAAYNAGEGAVAKYGAVPPYAETQNYVKEVGRRYGNAVRRQAKDKPVAIVPQPKIRETVDSEGRIHYQMP